MALLIDNQAKQHNKNLQERRKQLRSHLSRTWILDSDLVFINQLYANSILDEQQYRWKILTQNSQLKSRNKIEAKMASVFGDQMQQLSTELQQILIDDMVTAFENRLNVLNRVPIGSDF
jgi:hypothetical protein